MDWKMMFMVVNLFVFLSVCLNCDFQMINCLNRRLSRLLRFHRSVACCGSDNV